MLQTRAFPASTDEPGAAEDLVAFARRTLTNPILKAVLACAEGFVLVVDDQQRLVAANDELLHLLVPSELEGHLGRHVGEVLGCIHAGEGAGGCGNAAACAGCDAAQAIARGQAAPGPVSALCTFNLRRDGRLAAVAFRLKVSALQLGCHRLTVLVLQEVTAQCRADWLEDTFLADLEHTILGLTSWGERVADGASDPRRAARRITELCLRLQRDLTQRRLLRQAEQGRLAVDLERVPLADLFEELRERFLLHGESGPRLLVERVPLGIDLRTDRELLLQVLQGLVRWALAAVPPGAAVQVNAAVQGLRCRLAVQTPMDVDARTAARIFHPEVAGTGHDFGVYGAKLVLEDYLGGTLSFQSTSAEGACFTLELPRG